MVMHEVIDHLKMRAAAARTADILKTLANEDRLMILCFLSQGEAAVGQIETCLGITQPTLSQQLTVLRKKNLVTTRREGKQIFYAVYDQDLLALLQTLYQLYCP